MIETLLSFVQNALSPFHWSLNWVNVLQILFIGLIILIFYRRFIRNTQSEKLIKGLFFAGEVVDIDGFTGGFNLQAAFSMGNAAGRFSST